MDDTLGLAALLPAPVAYVLGGGGSYGAVQMGMLRALAETDLRPELVVGTSVGALNGAILSADPEQAPAAARRDLAADRAQERLPGQRRLAGDGRTVEPPVAVRPGPAL